MDIFNFNTDLYIEQDVGIMLEHKTSNGNKARIINIHKHDLLN